MEAVRCTGGGGHRRCSSADIRRRQHTGVLKAQWHWHDAAPDSPKRHVSRTAAEWLFLPSFQDALYGDGLDFSGSSGGPSPGDIAGAGLWATSLYYCSPLQLLLLFLGDVQTERPSDWLLRVLGSATGQPCALLTLLANSACLDTGSCVFGSVSCTVVHSVPPCAPQTAVVLCGAAMAELSPLLCRVEDAQYSAPLVPRAAVIAACAAGGGAIAWALDAGLGAALSASRDASQEHVILPSCLVRRISQQKPTRQ